MEGHLGGSVVKRLPWAQVMNPGSWDQAPHQAPCSAGKPASPSPTPPACVPSLTVSLSNK